jgi:hypothetical protein
VVTRFALDGWKNVRQPLVGNENWDVWADLDGSSSLTTRYVRGDVIDQLFARIEEDPEGDIPYWYLTDHLGSIRDVIDGRDDLGQNTRFHPAALAVILFSSRKSRPAHAPSTARPQDTGQPGGGR